jgi:hypothetical protein
MVRPGFGLYGWERVAMKGEELRAALERIGWSLGRLGVETEYGDRWVRRWASDRAEIPAAVAAWLREFVALLDRMPRHVRGGP